jgi:hypothetical protein
MEVSVEAAGVEADITGCSGMLFHMLPYWILGGGGASRESCAGGGGRGGGAVSWGTGWYAGIDGVAEIEPNEIGLVSPTCLVYRVVPSQL